MIQLKFPGRVKQFFYALLITLIQLFGAYLVFGCWLEDHEAIYKYLMAGIYTLQPLEMVFNDVYCGIIPFLCKLANLAYPLPLNDFILYAIIAICCLIINYCVLVLVGYEHVKRLGATFIIFSLILFPQFTVLVQSTRGSILLSMTAFFAAFVFFKKGEKNLWGQLLIILLLLAGTVMRIFTAGMATGLILAFALLWNPRFLQSRFGRIFILFFLIQAGLVAGLIYYRTYNNHPAERYVNYEYAITSRNDLFPLSRGSTREDSLRYRLMQHELLTDTVSLSENFLRKSVRHLTVGDILRDPGYYPERFSEAKYMISSFARKYSYMVIALIALMVILPWKQKIKGLIWAGVVVAALIVPMMLTSMFERAFAPLACLSVAGLWLLWVQHDFNRKSAFYLFLPLICSASYLSIRHLVEIRKENIRWHQAWGRFSEAALQFDSLHPLVMPSADMVMFSNKAFEKLPPRHDGIIMLNAGYVSLYEFLKKPYRERYNLDVTNGGSVADFIRLQGEKGVVILTTHEGLELFQDYLEVFFALDIAKENLPLPPIESPEHTLNFLSIKATREIE